MMNSKLMLDTGIANIDCVFGGMRGTTLSSHHNLRHWPAVVESGVKSIIDLRDGDHTDRLCLLCEKNGVHYFSFPMDSHLVSNERVVANLQEFFRLIDAGDFYIACAMGLHRTDLALSIYWVFHGAEQNVVPPFLKGHVDDSRMVLERFNNKVVRRLNSLYAYLQEHPVISIPDAETFKRRKRELREYTEGKLQNYGKKDI